MGALVLGRFLRDLVGHLRLLDGGDEGDFCLVEIDALEGDAFVDGHGIVAVHGFDGRLKLLLAARGTTWSRHEDGAHEDSDQDV